jgi:hypothetical protein
LREYYAGHLGDADLEERLLRHVDIDHFRAICQDALEGLAAKKLNLDMLIERRARAQERRVVPETIARFLGEAAAYVPLTLDPVPSLPHTFESVRIPTVLRRYTTQTGWRWPSLAARYPRLSTDRDTADTHSLEWVTPGHPFFEALRSHTLSQAQEVFGTGACFSSLQHHAPARLDFYRARVVDGLGHVVHERLYALELTVDGDVHLQEPSLLGNCTPTTPPTELPPVATLPETTAWLHTHALTPFLEEVQTERQAEIDRIASHVELSLTELLQKTDEEIGRAVAEIEQSVPGAEGRLAQAEARHAELLHRRERRRQELQHQRAVSLQNVDRIASALIFPHPRTGDS